MQSSDWVKEYPCPYCSGGSSQMYHGGTCPKVKSIEYYENGTIKKVEFHDWAKGANNDQTSNLV